MFPFIYSMCTNHNIPKKSVRTKNGHLFFISKRF